MVGNFESGHQVERWHATILKGPTIKRCHRINEQRLFLLRFSLFMLWLCFYHLWPSFPRQPPHDYWHFTKIGFLNSQILEFPRRNGQHAQNLQIPKFPQEILQNCQRWKIMPLILGTAQLLGQVWIKPILKDWPGDQNPIQRSEIPPNQVFLIPTPAQCSSQFGGL